MDIFRNMGMRENLQKLISKKHEEIAALELKITETRAYIQGLQDSMKLLPRDLNDVAGYALREGTALAKARDAIKLAGAPMTVSDLLKAIGKSQDKKHRVSLAGTLSGYARDGKVFLKTAPNTFGLIEFKNQAPEADPDIPEEFGNMS
jgi:hypothetical protein